jgi:hypothetical protein
MSSEWRKRPNYCKGYRCPPHTPHWQCTFGLHKTSPANQAPFTAARFHTPPRPARTHACTSVWVGVHKHRQTDRQTGHEPVDCVRLGSGQPCHGYVWPDKRGKVTRSYVWFVRERHRHRRLPGHSGDVQPCHRQPCDMSESCRLRKSAQVLSCHSSWSSVEAARKTRVRTAGPKWHERARDPAPRERRPMRCTQLLNHVFTGRR